MSTKPFSIAFLCLTLIGSTMHAQQPTDHFTPSVQQQAEDLIAARSSTIAMRDAEELLAATKLRRWAYRGHDGVARHAYEAYGHMAIHNDEPWVVFANRRRVPLSLLEPDEQKLVEKIRTLIERVGAHHSDLVRELEFIVQQQAVQAQHEAMVLQEMEHQRMMQATVPRLLVVQDFVVQMPTKTGTTPIRVSVNQEFSALAETEDKVQIELYGDVVWIPKHYFQMIGRVPRSSNLGQPEERRAAKPALPDVEPPKLDVQLEFDARYRGGLVKSVHQGGEGERLGILAGDVIEEINGLPIDSLAGAQTAMRAGNGRVKLTINRGGRMLVRSTAASGAGGGLPLGVTSASPSFGGGMAIVTTMPNSVCSRLNLGRGTVILSVNGMPMTTPESLYHFNANPSGRYAIEIATPFGTGSQTLTWPQ